MSTWNGIGTTYRGFSRRLDDGSHHATEWFVLLLLPIVPLQRVRLHIGATTYGLDLSSFTQYRVLETTPLVFGEILLTYVVGWIAFPVLAFTPLVLTFTAGIDARENFYLLIAAFLAAVAWAVAAPMIASGYFRRRRGLPKS